MPTYNFRHKKTEEIIECFMSISAREQFLLDNPDYETIILEAPAVGDPAALGYQKPPADFIKYVRDPIVQRNRGVKSERYTGTREI